MNEFDVMPIRFIANNKYDISGVFQDKMRKLDLPEFCRNGYSVYVDGGVLPGVVSFLEVRKNGLPVHRAVYNQSRECRQEPVDLWRASAFMIRADDGDDTTDEALVTPVRPQTGAIWSCHQGQFFDSTPHDNWLARCERQDVGYTGSTGSARIRINDPEGMIGRRYGQSRALFAWRAAYMRDFHMRRPLHDVIGIVPRYGLGEPSPDTFLPAGWSERGMFDGVNSYEVGHLTGTREAWWWLDEGDPLPFIELMIEACHIFAHASVARDPSKSDNARQNGWLAVYADILLRTTDGMLHLEKWRERLATMAVAQIRAAKEKFVHIDKYAKPEIHDLEGNRIYYTSTAMSVPVMLGARRLSQTLARMNRSSESVEVGEEAERLREWLTTQCIRSESAALAGSGSEDKRFASKFREDSVPFDYVDHRQWFPSWLGAALNSDAEWKDSPIAARLADQTIEDYGKNPSDGYHYMDAIATAPFDCGFSPEIPYLGDCIS